MKKTIVTLMLLAGVASAASIGYDEMNDTQKADVVAYWSDTQTLTPTSDVYSDEDTGTSFTISFDIANINITSTDSNIASFAGSHHAYGWDDGKMFIRMSESGSLTLINTNGTSTNSWSEYFDGSTYGNQTVSAYSSDLGLTSADSLTTTTTFTLVSDIANKTFTIYKNGTQIDQWTNWNTDTGLIGFQFGGRYGGGTKLAEGESVDFDNITVWNRALTESEVSALIIPEPATATLSLLALCGLAARRRRK